MANQLVFTTYYDDGEYVVEAVVHPDKDVGFPDNIFLHLVNSDGSLGEFQAIGQIDQVARYPDYDPNRTSNFGIHLVKYTEMRRGLPTEDLRDGQVIAMKSAFSNLLAGYEALRVPVEEIYPPASEE